MQTPNLKNNTHNLSTKVTSSAIWLFLFQISDNVLGFIRLLILARLLSPADFGLVAIAWLVLQTIGAFTQTGIHQTLIHKQNIEKYLDTAWTFLLIRGFALYGLVYLFSGLLGSFFNSPDAVAIIKVVSFTMVLDGFVNIGVVLFQKNLTFNKQFVFQLSANFIDFIVALTMAFILKNVWALVYGALASSLARIVLSYILSSYRPKFAFNFEAFKEMNNYGKWIAGSNVLQFIYSQGDDLLVGKLLGPTALGFYQLAYRISNLPATQITHIISAVLFPAYSNIQTDKERISKIYLSVLQVISFLSFFVGTIIICFAHDFTLLFLGEKWLPMVFSMQLLTLWGVMRSIGATTGPVWQALGTPKTVTKIQTLQTIILIAVIFPLTIKGGINGTSLAVVISALIPNIIAIYQISKTIESKLYVVLTELFYPLLASIFIAVSYLLINQILPNITLVNFLIKAAMTSVIYILFTYVLFKFARYTVYSNIFDLILSNPLPETYRQKLLKLKKKII